MEILEKLKRSARLPSPPGIALQILHLAQKADVSLAQVANALSADPALSLQILKYANSPLVGAPREVTTVREAVVLLGMRTVRMMALSFSLVSKEDKRACPGFDFDQFWADSLAHAIASRQLAKQDTKVPPEEAFAAAIVSTIGRLTFAFAMPKDYAEILVAAQTTGEDIDALERDWFGADYCETGGALLAHWKIPNRLALAVRYQCELDNPALPADIKPLAAILNEARPYIPIVRDPLKEIPGAAGWEQLEASSEATTRAELVEAMRTEFQEFAAILAEQGKGSTSVEQIEAEAQVARKELNASAPDPPTSPGVAESRSPGGKTTGGSQPVAGAQGSKPAVAKATQVSIAMVDRAAFDRRVGELWAEA